MLLLNASSAGGVWLAHTETSLSLQRCNTTDGLLLRRYLDWILLLCWQNQELTPKIVSPILCLLASTPMSLKHATRTLSIGKHYFAPGLYQVLSNACRKCPRDSDRPTLATRRQSKGGGTTPQGSPKNSWDEPNLRAPNCTSRCNCRSGPPSLVDS